MHTLSHTRDVLRVFRTVRFGAHDCPLYLLRKGNGGGRPTGSPAVIARSRFHSATARLADRSSGLLQVVSNGSPVMGEIDQTARPVKRCQCAVCVTIDANPGLD